MARTVNYFTFQDNVIGNSDGSEWIVEQEIGNTMVLDSDIIVIDINGTISGSTIYFETKITPNSDYKPIAGIRINDFSLSTSTNGINESWMFEIGPMYSFRCRISGASNPITIISKISKSN